MSSPGSVLGLFSRPLQDHTFHYSFSHLIVFIHLHLVSLFSVQECRLSAGLVILEIFPGYGRNRISRPITSPSSIYFLVIMCCVSSSVYLLTRLSGVVSCFRFFNPHHVVVMFLFYCFNLVLADYPWVKFLLSHFIYEFHLNSEKFCY